MVTPATASVEHKWYDRLAQWTARRVPRIAARVIIRVHRRFVGARLTPLRLERFQIAVSPQDNCGHLLFYYGSYEPVQTALWDKLLRETPDAVVLDIGANIGYYSLPAAACGNVSRVVSFEPNALVLPILRFNTAVNPGLASKITAAETAVGDANGSVQFHRNFEPHNLGMGSMRGHNADAVTVDVSVVRLDSYLGSPEGPNRVDLIKVDVEGAEHLVVSGLTGWWAAQSRPTIVMEVHPAFLPEFGSSVPKLFATLQQAGYQLKILREDGELETAPDDLDSICWVVAQANVA